MKLKIYLDENIACLAFKNLLLKNGFEVLTPKEAGLGGQNDAVQLKYAKEHGCVLLTKNPADFLELHQAEPNHSGIVGIYQDNDVKKDMSHLDIMLTLKKMAQKHFVFTNNFIVLNHYRTARYRTFSNY